MTIRPASSVSVVICTRDRVQALRDCLRAISQLPSAPDEVLVIDNTTGQSETEDAAVASGARYIIEPASGLSRARNRGLTESRCDIVVYIDDDAVPTERWLEHLVSPFTDPNVAAVTGEAISPGSDYTHIAQAPTRALSRRDALWFETAAFGGLGIGANMALRRSACTGWRVFDERLGRGAPFRLGEESYAFASLIELGHLAVHVPAAVVFHPVKPIDVALEAKCSIAYWLLLFSKFPRHRRELLRFLIRRLRRKPLPWPRVPQEAGEIIRSGWRVHMKAGLAGLLLFLRTPSPRA